MEKLRVAIVGATGYVGQRFISLLNEHPWFELTALAASSRSAGKRYADAIEGRWKIDRPMPDCVKDMLVCDAKQVDEYCSKVDFCFCAVDMDKAAIRALEDQIACSETPVVSNNSAHRGTADVPMIIPELNSDHARLIETQRQRLGTRYGFVACKPNCSIQSYVPALTPLLKFQPTEVFVSTYQAISGAGKTFQDWPEMEANLIPYIAGEEEKSEKEPLKIWGKLTENGTLELASKPVISAQCYRVAVREGHTASVAVRFKNKPSREEILQAWADYKGEPQRVGLPTAPDKFLYYHAEENRPQPVLDADSDKGMRISLSRLREDPIFDYKFCCLSHNTLRGAAGGAVLTAELLTHMGYIRKKSND